MPDASGRFKGITVPELPWLKTSVQEGTGEGRGPPADRRPNRDKTPKL